MAIGYVVVVFQCFCQSSDEKGILLLWCTVTVGFLSGCLSCVIVWTFILPSYASDKAIDEIGMLEQSETSSSVRFGSTEPMVTLLFGSDPLESRER